MYKNGEISHKPALEFYYWFAKNLAKEYLTWCKEEQAAAAAVVAESTTESDTETKSDADAESGAFESDASESDASESDADASDASCLGPKRPFSPQINTTTTTERGKL